MKKISYSSILFSACIAMSCNNNAANENKSNAESGSSNKTIVTNNCLLSYAEDYAKLLTEEVVLQNTQFSKEVMKVKYSKVLKKTQDHSVSYSFSNKRTGIYPGTSMKMEVNDQIKLTGIKPLSLKEFTTHYRVVTDEELSVADKAIDDAIEGKSNNEKINKAAAELKQKGITEETAKSATSEIKGMFSKVGKSYITVEHLGDAATWNTFTNILNILSNGVHLELFVYINDDTETNKEMAIKIARQLLQKCAI